MTSPTGKRRSSRDRAFTLVELLLVMSILVVVIAVAMPSLAGFFRGRSLDSEARRLLALTHQGQSRAVFEGVPMLLWLDAKNRTYGLEEEPGYTDQDLKAVEFTVDEDLGLEPVSQALVTANNSPSSPTANLTSGTPVNVSVANRVNPLVARGRRANLPSIRFMPDGSFAESSPQGLRLFRQDGEEIWVALARNRLNYEIRSRLNDANEATR